MLSPTNPDEAFVVSGVPVTGRQLAEARQQLAHEGAYLDRWDELSGHDQEMAALAAGNYLRALARLLSALDATDAAVRASDERDETLTGADARSWAADHGHPQPERIYRVVLRSDGLVELGELLPGELAADYASQDGGGDSRG